MSENQEIYNIIPNSENDKSEYIIRHGDAAPVELPEALTRTGTIDAPAEYFTKRNPKPECTHVTVNRDMGTIQLTSEERTDHPVTITGVLCQSPQLQALQINTTKMWSAKELLKTIRMMRNCFNSIEDYTAVTTALQNLSLSVSISAATTQDNRGNRSGNMSKNVTSSIPNIVAFNMPIFKGMDAVTFPVDFCIETLDAGVTIWLESIALAELQEATRNSEIDRVVKQLDTLVVIYT